MNIYKSIDQLIGHTPLVDLSNIKKFYKLNAQIIGKVEYFNPTGSIKDRVAKAILDDARRKGFLNEKTVIIEATSGNLGVSLSAIATMRGYRVIIVMPETMSIEKRKLIQAYGAQLILTDGNLGMKGAIEKASQLAKEVPHSFVPCQFYNYNNPTIHQLTTGFEIWQDMQGQIDIFVSGVGTGGTISGVAQYLKKQNPLVQIIAVEPKHSAVLLTGLGGKHQIQGIGAGFVPKVLNTDIYDEIITVSDEEAFDMTKQIANKEGLLVGISSGAAVYAAIKLAKHPKNYGKKIVVILPDSGDRYLSLPMFDYL